MIFNDFFEEKKIFFWGAQLNYFFQNPKIFFWVGAKLDIGHKKIEYCNTLKCRILA